MYRHINVIKFGQKGEISKIDEELDELKDAYQHSTQFHSIIESADIIESVGQFTWKQYDCPLIFVVIFCYIRKPYKILRNVILDLCKIPKTYFFEGTT